MTAKTSCLVTSFAKRPFPEEQQRRSELYPARLTLPANVARLRFVVRDAYNGHMGTVDLTKF